MCNWGHLGKSTCADVTEYKDQMGVWEMTQN